MSGGSRVTLGWPALVVGAAMLLAAGSGGTYLALRTTHQPPATAQPRVEAGPAGMRRASPNSPGPSDREVTLSEEAIKRAGIQSAPVVAAAASGALRAPGVVQANAYQQIVVTPLVGGRVTRVAADLGQAVQKGQTLAQVFSPELAEAQTRYVSARAELSAHEQELARTEKLVGIGAASRQELERIHAEHTARRSDVESAASRLRLLGLSTDSIEALAPGTDQQFSVNVPSPIAGVVTERAANVGLNVDPSTALFTITDLATVWVVVDLYEKDFSSVRVGSPATIVVRAYPGSQLDGRVSYIDPQVSSDTRTAKARIQVSNPRRDLRLGMLAEAVFASNGTEPVPSVPRAAVQNVGNRTLVYLVDPLRPGTFIEREVQLGTASGENVSVKSGVEVGDVVVTQGSFAVRAERERLGLTAAPGNHEKH